MPPKKKARACKKKVAHPQEGGNQALSKASDLTPLGTLAILPREIRDEIYSYFCPHKTYKFKDNTYHDVRVKWSCWPGRPMPEINRPMLGQVSKAVREELHAVLYSKDVFYVSHFPFSVKTQRSEIPFFDFISNISIKVKLLRMSDISWYGPRGKLSPEDEEEFLMTIKAEPIMYFTGNSIMRNTCAIKFRHCGPKVLPTLLSSPAMAAISQLIGFNTVQLQFSASSYRWLKYETPECTRERIWKLGTCPGFDALVLRTSRALAPTLGSFSVEHGQPLAFGKFSGIWYQDVTFHPRNQPIKKPDVLEVKSSTQAEDLTSTYPFLEWFEDHHQ